MQRSLVLVLVLCGAMANLAWADKDPGCKRSGAPMAYNMKQVIAWKTSTKNQFQDRGYVVGQVVQALQDRDTHLHLDVNLDPSSNDTGNHIEAVYNKEFGPIPNFHRGSQIVVCGDYITSNKDTDRYKASPMGALIHWIHMSPNPQRHDDGFMMIDGVLTGQVNPGDRGNAALQSLWQGVEANSAAGF